MRRLVLPVLCAMVLALTCAKPASAATISLNARSDCECGQVLHPPYYWICWCYFSGTVTMSNPSSVLDRVDCWVSGVQAGSQSSGFAHTPGTTTWQYAHCCVGMGQIMSNVTYDTEDIAFANSGTQPAASGTAGWTP